MFGLTNALLILYNKKAKVIRPRRRSAFAEITLSEAKIMFNLLLPGWVVPTIVVAVIVILVIIIVACCVGAYNKFVKGKTEE